jgi:hypothetical protein
VKTKSPAFQFYPADYLSDMNTIAFTAEQDGHYIRLLCICWLEGEIPFDMDKIRSLLKGSSTISDETLNPVLQCFKLNEKKNVIFHPRLLKEKKKQSDWAKKCSAGGKASGRTRRGLNGSEGSSSIVEVNGNSSSSSSSLNLKSTQGKKSKYSFTEWDMNLSHTLFEECKKIVLTTKEPDFENWANEFRLMREIEKWHKEDILAILSWMYNEDEFWRGQVRSPQKLRKHYETMYAKRNAAKIGRRSNMNDY